MTADAGPVHDQHDPLQDVLYVGKRPDGGGGPAVIAVTTLDGTPLGVVRHRIKHSPTGISWGYLGSGAADCARSLLAAACGDLFSICRTCQGTNKITYVDDGVRQTADGDDPAAVTSCDFCDNGLTIQPFVYQAFKQVFVAAWKDEFAISRNAIVGWLKATFPDTSWPTVIEPPAEPIN